MPRPYYHRQEACLAPEPVVRPAAGRLSDGADVRADRAVHGRRSDADHGVQPAPDSAGDLLPGVRPVSQPRAAGAVLCPAPEKAGCPTWRGLDRYLF